MILNVYDTKDKLLINKLYKTIGVTLIRKYLPHLDVIKQFYLVNTLDEWNEIKSKFPETVTCRTDTIFEEHIPSVHGTTRERENIEDYIIDVSNKIKEPYFMCLEMEERSNERVNTQGGLYIDINVDKDIIAGYVGPGFDCGGLTKGEAEHETWVIPWDKNSIKRKDAIDKYRVGKIEQSSYISTAVKRIEFLIKEYPDRKQEIIDNCPKEYKGIEYELFEKMQKEILIPMYEQQVELMKNGLNHCTVEVNVVKENRLVPFEIGVSQRFREAIKHETQKSWKKTSHDKTMIYGKAKGIFLLNKYLPDLYPYKKIQIISSIEEWDKIKDKLPERVTTRTDTKIGDNRNVRISGTSGKKEDVPLEIEELKKQNPDGVLLLLDTKSPTIPRYENDGGFNVGFNINENVVIELVGKGFDGRELTREKAVHERYVIPWDEVLFIRNKKDMTKSRNVSMYEICDDEYKRTRQERVEFLNEKEKEIDREIIEENVPIAYKELDEEIIKNILDDVILELCKRKDELLRDGLRNFNVQGNIVDGKIVPWEIFRPERLIAKETKKDEFGDR